jgi:SAM-dependent MidA family methyltransferase
VTAAADRLRERIAAHGGPVPFRVAMEVALYDEVGGFYATGGRAGRRGDFVTSPEVGPLFGAVVARALDRWWAEAGEPDRLTVVEAGAGPGALARAVLSAGPACLAAGALRYTLVERSAAQRERHADLLERWPDLVSTTEALPSRSGGPAVVLANELLDNLPVDLLERTADGWAQVLVDADLHEVLGPLDLDGPVPTGAGSAAVGARVPVQSAAARWVGDALTLARPAAGGRVVLFDYAATTAELARRPQGEWLRTYRQHERGGAPLDALGTQDVTCEVCVDQLAVVAPPTADRSQADWLRAHGIDDLVAEGRAAWQERAAIGDLAAVRARSRIGEAEALLDPTGLGAFRVLEWSA